MTTPTDFHKKNGPISYFPFGAPLPNAEKNHPHEKYKFLVKLLEDTNWILIERNLHDCYDEQMGYEIWGSKNKWIQISSPYVFPVEFDSILPVILRENNLLERQKLLRTK